MVLAYRFCVAIRSYKKQLVKKLWGRILDLAWLKFAVAALCIMHIDGLLINLRTRTIFPHRKSKQFWKQRKYQSLKCFFNIDIWRLPWRREFDAEVWLQIRKNTYVLHVINSATSRQNNSFSLNLG